MELNSPIRELKGIGEKTEKLFQKIGVYTLRDILLPLSPGLCKISREKIHKRGGCRRDGGSCGADTEHAACEKDTEDADHHHTRGGGRGDDAVYLVSDALYQKYVKTWKRLCFLWKSHCKKQGSCNGTADDLYGRTI